MRDDVENREGNLGVGYRTLTPDRSSVVGGHLWLDRRVSDRGSTFHQVTTGIEFFKEDFELRANFYQPFFKTYRYSAPNSGQANPYLLNSGIFYDIAGSIVEEPQRGADFEIGLPVKGLPGDSFRVYGGGFAFGGRRTDAVYGPRLRLLAGVTPDIDIAARVQRDNERGSQGFIEATLRFPMGSKPSIRAEGIRARLAEAPERDIDVVTGESVSNSVLASPILNAFTGEQQRVFHVDNTAAAGGNGSLENPFNTLSAADAEANGPGDVIYVHRGDATSSGMNQGVTLDQQGQWLMGSGSAFTYDPAHFQSPGRNIATGSIIAPATLAPVISNVQPSGDGVNMTAGDTIVAGLSVQSAQRDGINASAAGGQTFEGITVRDVTTNSNGRTGVYVSAAGVGTAISDVTVMNVISNSNVNSGVYITPSGGGQIQTATLDSITTQNSGTFGIVFDSTGVGTVLSNVTARNIYSTGNAYGLLECLPFHGPCDMRV